MLIWRAQQVREFVPSRHTYMANPLSEELDGTGVVAEPEVATPFLTINGSESFLGIPVYIVRWYYE